MSQRNSIINNQIATWSRWNAALAWALFVGVSFLRFSPVSFASIYRNLIPSWKGGTMSVVPAYLVSTALFLILFVAAIGLGHWWLKRLSVQWGSALELIVFSGATGYALLSIFGFLLGVTGFLYKQLIFALITGLALFFVFGKDSVTFRSRVRSAGNELASDIQNTSSGRWLALASTIVLVIAAVMAFVPEIFYDALVYHLGVPNLYLLEHRFVRIPNYTAQFPLAIQMVYLYGLALGGDTITKLTHISFAFLLALAFIALGRRFEKPAAGLWSAAIFLSIPTVQMDIWVSNIDLGVSLFAFLSYAAFLFYIDKERNHWWFLLSAFFSGMAVASKYTAVYVPLSIMLVFIGIEFRNRRSVRALIKTAGLFVGVALVPVVPWFLKNLWETGNPVYPFLNHVWGNFPIPEWRYEKVRNVVHGMRFGEFRELLYLPWKLSIQQRTNSGFQGPMMLGMIGFFLIGIRGVQKSIRVLLVLGVVGCALILFSTTHTRYWLPMMTAAVAAFGFALAAVHSQRVLVVFGFFYFIQLSWGFLKINQAFSPADVLSGQVSRLDFLMENPYAMRPNPPFRMYKYMEDNLPDYACVLLVGEEKVFPLQVRHMYSGMMDQNPLIALCNTNSDSAKVAEDLLHRGITHVMINQGEAARLSEYGIFDWQNGGEKTFLSFLNEHTVRKHIELDQRPDGYENRIDLFEIRIPA